MAILGERRRALPDRRGRWYGDRGDRQQPEPVRLRADRHPGRRHLRQAGGVGEPGQREAELPQSGVGLEQPRDRDRQHLDADRDAVSALRALEAAGRRRLEGERRRVLQRLLGDPVRAGRVRPQARPGDRGALQGGGRRDGDGDERDEDDAQGDHQARPRGAVRQVQERAQHDRQVRAGRCAALQARDRGQDHAQAEVRDPHPERAARDGAGDRHPDQRRRARNVPRHRARSAGAVRHRRAAAVQRRRRSRRATPSSTG